MVDRYFGYLFCFGVGCLAVYSFAILLFVFG